MRYLFSLILMGILHSSYGQYSLGLNLELGNTYFLNLTGTLNMNGEVNGQKMNFSSTMNGLARFKVIRNSGGEYELDGSYDSLHMSMRSPMGQMEFSSGPSNRKSDMTSGALDMMTNKHFKVILLKNGAIRKIQSGDTAGFATLLSHFPAADQIKKMLLMGHMNHHLNPKAMQENLEMLTAIYPNKKVNLNEQWGSTIQPDSGMEHIVKTNYQLVEYSGGQATIKGHSTSKANNSMKQGSQSPAIYDLDGTSESTFKVDAATGWIREADIKNDLTGQIQIKDSNMSKGMGKNIPIQVVAIAKISNH